MEGTSFIALYRGATIRSARLVAVSADPRLAADVARRILREPLSDEDSVVATLERGRRSALRAIAREDRDAPSI